MLEAFLRFPPPPQKALTQKSLPGPGRPQSPEGATKIQKFLNKTLFVNEMTLFERGSQKTTKDPEIEGSRSQQRSVTDHPPFCDCTETQ